MSLKVKNSKLILMHILTAEQFSKSELEAIFKATDDIKKAYLKDKSSLLKKHQGKEAVMLFYEPSTRTRLSFESGAKKIGISPTSTENAGITSSSVKGETIEDTMHMLNEYKPDLVIIRHSETGGVARAAKIAEMPVINAGDGKGEHPTQSLLDAYTIWQNHGKLNNLKIVMGGDLLQGRTVRSLSKIITLFENNHIVFNSIPELQMANDVKDYLMEHGTSFEEESDMKKAFQDADVVYWTRLQRERLPAGVEINQTYSINNKAMAYLPKKSIVMHPLPRVDEINTEVDKDPRAKYFEQAGNGMWLRMALMDKLLSSHD